MNYLKPSIHNRPNPPARRLLSVMAIFRDEAHVIDEWIHHYRSMGVQHFYLINNKSSDDYLAKILPYVAEGLVDLFDCEADNFQIGAYTDLLPTIAAQTEWVGIFDLDEFVYAPSGKQITDVVSEFSKYESILIPWLSFGSAGRREQPPSVIEGFVRRGDAAASRAMLKPICRPGDVTRVSQHNPTTRRGAKVLANGQEFGDEHFIRIAESQVCDFALINNHYRVQSQEHFRQVKAARPEVNEEVAGQSKRMKFFWDHDFRWNSLTDRRLADLHAARRAKG